MAFVVKVEGADAFEISKECVKSVKMTTDIPQDSNARTKDVGASMVITGKILTAVGGDPFDSTRKMALWSVVPAERADCYRKVTVEYIAAGIMERKYCFPNAFVVDYREDYGDEAGIGTFTLIIKQKKDKFNAISVEGGYSA
ncbi:MAG: membrane-associated protease 1 [Clostridium sp.]|nr:membrane-associated protease 1 [Clostridium sp.]MCM1425635.1 membrane-associated protease 1 [Eubacterium sp.]